MRGHLTLQVFERTPDFTVAEHAGVVMILWRGTPRVTTLRRVARYLEVVRDQRKRFSVVIIIEPSHTTPPDTAAREENARLTHRFESECLGIATVLEGTQIKHSLIRFAMATVQLMSSARFPQAIFDSTRDASSWISRLHENVSNIDVMNAIKQARSIEGPHVSSSYSTELGPEEVASTAVKKAR